MNIYRHIGEKMGQSVWILYKKKNLALYLLLPCIFRVSGNMQGNCNVDRRHCSKCASRVAPKSGPELYSFNRVASFSCTKSIASGRLG